MKDMPGYLVPVKNQTKWLDLVYNSDLEPMHKLTATVLSKTTLWNKQERLYMTNCSPYTVSRILKTSIPEAKVYMQDLLDYGWLWDTGKPRGARQVYITCVNVKPKEIYK